MNWHKELNLQQTVFSDCTIERCKFARHLRPAFILEGQASDLISKP